MGSVAASKRNRKRGRGSTTSPRDGSSRSRFRATLTDWNYLDVSAGPILTDNQTVTRFSEDAAYPLHRLYDCWQTDLTVDLPEQAHRTHNVLIGFEYGFESVVRQTVFSDAPSIKSLQSGIFQPGSAGGGRSCGPISSIRLPLTAFPSAAQPGFTTHGGCTCRIQITASAETKTVSRCAIRRIHSKIRRADLRHT